MIHKHLIPFIIVPLSLACYGFYAVRPSNGPAFGINIDLSKPTAITWPCEIAIVGDEGEKGLRIGSNIGRGWRGEAGGDASYSFLIPKDGKYYIWAYSLWFDECANAIFLKIDESDKAIIGNDPIYNEWHWVRGFAVKLKEGTHTLTLSNHSDHVSLLNIVLANSSSLGPNETSTIFSDVFYDGFDGCDQGNFKQWQQISGTWQAVHPIENACLEENALVGHSEDQGFIYYENHDWQSYSLDLSVNVTSSDVEGSISVCFGVVDPNNFFQLRITPMQQEGLAQMSVIRMQAENSHSLAEFESSFACNQWQSLQIQADTRITIKVADNTPIQIETEEIIQGGIGFRLNGKISACFDDIHVRAIGNPIEKNTQE